MHFVTGGAFNGKREWVTRTYGITDQTGWISAYTNGSIPEELSTYGRNLLVLEGIEVWVRMLTEKCDAAECQLLWNSYLDHWLDWEKAGEERQLVVVGTDITKGIVPLDKDRLWRDVTGWTFQNIAAKSERADIIWYGIAQKIK